MDIGRSFFEVQYPRSRLDAGTYATMGLGLGYAIAAALHYPNRRVIAVEGDSAFGFSGMEVETMARLKLPIVIIIINNSGIGIGLDQATYDALPTNKVPALALRPGTRYDKMAEVVGGRGWHVETPDQLRKALGEALADKTAYPAIVHVVIEPNHNTDAGFTWLAAPKL
jgi:2-hydroxyacyl-CoA lyase 1